MSAINFIQQHGIEKAREVVEGAPPKDDRVWYFFVCRECGCGGSSERLVTDSYICDYAACPGCGAEDFDDDWDIYDELKRLVDSVDEINGVGGIGMAKLINQTVDGEHLDLEQSIAAYEAIYSGAAS